MAQLPRRFRVRRHRKQTEGSGIMGRWVEKSAGFLLVVAGLVWAALHTMQREALDPGFLRLGPMQVLLLGSMLWLHGKFRKAPASGPSMRH